ncbi:MAG: GNAT family N-acetyltransferase, partial [Leptospiraceae bacterium]|nr:GNAT family N-acetyltransferase [Leptospiraceae bacterium]
HSAETFEIGCWIDKDYYNKGIATKSTYKLVEISFNEFSAKKVELYCALDNTTSNHIANKLGFKLEGTIRNSIKIQDELIPQNIYGMLKEEFSEL